MNAEQASDNSFEYEVTPEGKVFSCSSNWRGYGKREMTQKLNSDGYPSVRITINGKRRRMAVHRLVAEKYLGPRPLNSQIRNLDGNKLNARLDNLAYGTAKGNADDREQHGRTSRGISHSIYIKHGFARFK